jgi:hypothetical protein
MNYKSKYANTPAEGLERKNQAIGKFQDTKELSIRVQSSLRDSVLIATARDGFSKMTDDEIKAEITKWREWLFGELDANEIVKRYTSPF